MNKKTAWLAVLAVVLTLTASACHRKKSPPKAGPPPSSGRPKIVRIAFKPAPHGPIASAPQGELAERIEKLTSAHTRLVWSETGPGQEGDPFSYGNEQTLGGIDTRDGHGVRTILPNQGNYTRPLLTLDGEGILFASLTDVGKGRDKQIYWTTCRTDWAGSPPVPIADGLVLSVWRDPATDVEWVYCGRKRRGHRNSEAMRQIWRFQLNAPDKEEMVYDDTPVTTSDNVQLSRDGKRACALLPWPKGGIIKFDENPPSGMKLTNGCWPSMAPDNSKVSWVFRGDHRSANFFADDGARSWSVSFDAPCITQGEAYHPRWSNHARFMTLTGPYLAKTKGEMPIHGSENRPEVYLGRFNEQATKMEGWVQVTSTGTAKSYPDAWIAGGGTSSLTITPSASPASAPAAPAWPQRREGLAFLWNDRSAANNWKGPDGRTRSADLEGTGAARYGKLGEIVFDGGSFKIDEEEDQELMAQIKGAAGVSFETMLCFDGSVPPHGWIFRLPGLSALLQDGAITMIDDTGVKQAKLPALTGNVHLTIVRRGAEVEIWVNGSRLAAIAAAALKPGTVAGLTLGEGSVGLGLKGIAIFARALPPEEVIANAGHQLKVNPAPAPVRRVTLSATLVEVSQVPTLESIQPYTGALISCVYEVKNVTGGNFAEQRILVKHWGLLNRQLTTTFPRKIGQTYDLVVEQESDHSELRGERIVDDTTAFDLVPWIDVSRPQIKE